jgi:hypothetical protein
MDAMASMMLTSSLLKLIDNMLFPAFVVICMTRARKVKIHDV